MVVVVSIKSVDIYDKIENMAIYSYFGFPFLKSKTKLYRYIVKMN